MDQIYRNFLKLLKMNYKKKINSIKNKYGKFNSNELNYILNVIDDKTKNIDYVQKLEGEFCKKFKVRYSIACNSGTSDFTPL